MSLDKTFFINLRNEDKILNEKNDLIFGMIKEDIINNYVNQKDFTDLHNLMKNELFLEIFFKRNIFKSKTKINLNGVYVSLRVYSKKTNNKYLKDLLLKYNFVKLVSKLQT